MGTGKDSGRNALGSKKNGGGPVFGIFPLVPYHRKLRAAKKLANAGFAPGASGGTAHTCIWLYSPMRAYHQPSNAGEAVFCDEASCPAQPTRTVAWGDREGQ